MAKVSERYSGVNVFGPNDEKIGTVNGLLTSDDRRQYYVVESREFLRRNRTTFYIPADKGIATDSQRLSIDVAKEQFDALGWTSDPAASSRNPA